MSWWKKICALFARQPEPEPQDYGPCQNCRHGRVTQKGEFRCYGCWNADNYEAGL